jgi:Zn-dependent protease with chaperone function
VSTSTERIVRRIEAEASDGYDSYLRRVRLLGALGVAYPIAIIAGVVALAVGGLFALHALGDYVVWLSGYLLKIALLALIPIYLTFKSLFFRWPEPEGTRLERSDAPELFALLDRLRQRFNVAPLAGVFVDPRFNASIQQLPRFGFFGGSRSYLAIGMPLLLAVTSEQFEAILAHEFGHLARNHGSVGTSIYAMRAVMARLLQAMAFHTGRLNFALRPFYKRFVPYFDAYSLVVARRVELAADDEAAEIAGARTFASALVALAVQEARLQRDVWLPLHALVATMPDPPSDIFARVGAVAMEPLPDAGAFLEVALGRAARFDDTHPALAERLRRLDVSATDALLPLIDGHIASNGTAATALLGDKAQELAVAFSRTWAAESAAEWRKEHKEISRRNARLSELDALAATGSLDDVGRRELAHLAFQSDRSDAEDLCRDLLSRDAADPLPNLILGWLLARAGTAGAIEHFALAERAAGPIGAAASRSREAYERNATSRE